ncbi:MAG: hypothetical protein ABNH38_15365 [Tateyamaria sp.]|uniref:hypothetical protein n=1 Tax=Tateyamaria sp. TaxID=1929288 RepID=UPI0032DC9BFC
MHVLVTRISKAKTTVPTRFSNSKTVIGAAASKAKQVRTAGVYSHPFLPKTKKPPRIEAAFSSLVARTLTLMSFEPALRLVDDVCAAIAAPVLGERGNFRTFSALF